MKKIFCCLLFLLLSAQPLFAAEQQPLIIATAANFSRPMDEIVRLFEAEKGVKVDAIYSSTGAIYAQIENGAPYDLFFAADTRRPDLLYQEGLCEEPFVYARGRVVLWSPGKDLASVSAWQEVLRRDDTGKIGIANPKTAPYGEMALTALREAGLLQLVEDRLVYAQNVAQAFQYGQSGAVDLTFTALSYALSEEGKKGTTWLIPEAPPIVQAACVLKRTNRKSNIEMFVAFLKSQKVQGLIAKYGYQ